MAKSSSAKKKATSKPTTSPSKAPSSPPKPWTAAPPSLSPFLSNLPHDHFYILSLDTHPRAFKRRLFHVPLFLNIFLTITLLYRLFTAIPTYLDMFLQAMGHTLPSSQKVDVRALPGRTALALWLKRALMFLGDFVLVRVLSLWPLDFFLGKGALGMGEGEWEVGPVGWRRAVGYLHTEIVVRRSRKWDRSVFYKEVGGGAMGRGEGGETVNGIEGVVEWGVESSLVKEVVAPKVKGSFVRAKTGYQMLDRDWELDFGGMVVAHALVDEGTCKLEDYKTAVVVYTERWGWVVWQVWRDHEGSASDDTSSKLQLVKDGLTKAGKENLFFRTIEVIQSETSQEGPFTAERRDKAISKVREEFEEQGLDFDDFWNACGGIESMPGLEVST